MSLRFGNSSKLLVKPPSRPLLPARAGLFSVSRMSSNLGMPRAGCIMLGNFRPQFVASILVGVFQMSSLERRLAAVTNRAANLNRQLRELYKLRDYAHHTPRGLDPYGRFSAVRNSIEQAVLDIPTFLGRKAN